MGREARIGLLLGACACLLAVMVDWVVEELSLQEEAQRETPAPSPEATGTQQRPAQPAAPAAAQPAAAQPAAAQPASRPAQTPAQPQAQPAVDADTPAQP